MWLCYRVDLRWRTDLLARQLADRDHTGHPMTVGAVVLLLRGGDHRRQLYQSERERSFRHTDKGQGRADGGASVPVVHKVVPVRLETIAM